MIIFGEHNDTAIAETQLNLASDYVRSGARDFDARSLLKNICEPYVICNKKKEEPMSRSALLEKVRDTLRLRQVLLQETCHLFQK